MDDPNVIHGLFLINCTIGALFVGILSGYLFLRLTGMKVGWLWVTALVAIVVTGFYADSLDQSVYWRSVAGFGIGFIAASMWNARNLQD